MFKAVHQNLSLGVKLACQPPGNAVQFHPQQSSALHSFRQQPEEVAYPHRRF